MSTNRSKILGFDHVSIVVKDAEASKRFYQTLLGLPCLPRPDLGFPGYWLDLGAAQSLHIMQLDHPFLSLKRPKHGGRDFHFALRVESLQDFIPVIEQLNLPYTMSQSGRKALFLKDLDGNPVELFCLD